MASSFRRAQSMPVLRAALLAGPPEFESSDTRRLMVGLRSRVPTQQHEAAQSLRDFVETDAQELAPQEMHIFLSEMFKGIEQLLNSAEAHELAGAVVAIDVLMDVEAEDATTRLPRFAKYLRTALAHEANTPSTLHLARDALGHLARAGGSLTSEVVDEEAKRSLDVLRDDGPKARGGTNRERAAQELRTLCAALVLQALAENAPTVMYAHVGLAFEHLWSPLCAPSAQVRSAAAAALQACLRLVATRVSNQQLKWYSELLAASRVALARDSNVHSWHGGLLALEALLACCHAHASDEFVLECFGVAADAAMLHIAQRRSAELHAAALRLLPELARARPDEFVELRLEHSLRLLAEAARDTRARTPGLPQRAEAFATQAAVLELLGRERLAPHTTSVVLPRLMPTLRDALGKGAKSKLYCAEALLGLGALAVVGGAELRGAIEPLLPAVLMGLPISRELTRCLRQLAAHVPSLSAQIELRLRDLVSQQLAGLPWSKASSAASLQAHHANGTSGPQQLQQQQPHDEAATGGGGQARPEPAPAPQAPLAPADRLRQLLLAKSHAAPRDDKAAQQAAALVDPEEGQLLALQTLAALPTQAQAQAQALPTGGEGSGEGGGSGDHPCIDGERGSDEQLDFVSLRFVVMHVAPLLRAPAAPLRREAALCCCTLLAPAGRAAPLEGEVGAMVGHVLSQLLGVVVADPDASIRQAVLRALDGRFHEHLCEVRRLRTVAFALHDEALAVRLVAVPLLGRLSALNPAATLPQLRKLLLSLQCELTAAEPSHRASCGSCPGLEHMLRACSSSGSNLHFYISGFI